MKHARGPYNGPNRNTYGDARQRSYGGYHQASNGERPFDGPYKQYAMSNEQVRGRAAHRRQKSTARKVGTVIGIIVLALLMAVVGFYLWFTISLNNSRLTTD